MANATETKNHLDDSDISDLFEHRISLDLTPENAKFTRSAGNLISLEVTQPSGKVEFLSASYPSVLSQFPHRTASLPSANPTHN